MNTKTISKTWIATTGAISLVAIGLVFLLHATATQSSFNWVAALVVSVIVAATAIVSASTMLEGRRYAKDRLATVLVYSAFALAMIPLVSVVIAVLSKGLARFDAMFFSNSMRSVVGEGGGAIHAIVGTLQITGMATLISVPIGLLTAIYVVEYGRGNLSRAIVFFVDVMTGIPSIVAGLFAYALFLLIFGPGAQNGMAGAVALSVLMIPVVIRSAEEMLRLVPNELREASYALGVPRWLTIVKVVLPTSIAGITTGVMLAIARVIGETAPLLVTVGMTQSMNYSLTNGPMMTLPTFVYNSFMSPGVDAQAYLDRAWTGAFTLILIVMLLNLVARLVARYFAPKGMR